MTGSLQVNRGTYYAYLNLKVPIGNGKFKRKQKPVNLHIKDVPGNKRKAEKAFRDVLAKYEDGGKAVYREDTLFCDYLNVWLEAELKPRRELITYESYKSYIETHMYPFFSKLGVCLQELNYTHLQAYYDHAAEEKKLSPNSLKKHHTVINQTLRKALKDELIDRNPAKDVVLEKTERFTGSFLTVEQGNLLLEVSKGKPMEPVVILGMMYGLRRSEIAGLKWSAINLQENTLTIRHTVTKFKTQIARDGTKNQSSNRTLYLNRVVKEYLANLHAQQMQDKLLFGQAYHDTEYVCRWPDGRALSCDYLSKAFKKLLRKYGLPNIRLHDLRHSCASYMLKMGCSMKEVADWLGHADIKTAMNVYGHIDVETKKATAERFAGFLKV